MTQQKRFPFFPETHLFGSLPISDKRQKLFLYAILLSAVLLRVTICFILSPQHIQRDTIDYFEQADILLDGGYKNYFPNGYPFIIALCKRFAGEQYVNMLLWLNIILSTIMVYYVYSITFLLSGVRSMALTAAVLLALFPTQLNYVRWILSEVPSTFFLVGFFFYYFKKKFWLSGLFLGITTLIRTEFILVLPIILLYELIFLRTFRTWFVIMFLLPVCITGLYSFQKTGQFSLSGHGKVNILYSITASGGYVDWMYHVKHPEVTTSRQALQMYVDSMKANPLDYIKRRSANLWELWGFFPSSSDGNRTFPARLFIGGTNLFLLVFGFFGWWKKRKNYYAFTLLIPFLIVTIVHTFLLALPRYTYAAEPFLLIFTAICFCALINKKQEKAVH